MEDMEVARAGSDEKCRQLIAQLREKKDAYGRLLMEIPADSQPPSDQNRNAGRIRLMVEIENIESALARYVTNLGRCRRALTVTIPQVQACIPKDAVLLEFIQYDHYLGKQKWENRYGVIALGSAEKPKWIPLGEARKIEKTLRLYQQAARGNLDEGCLSTNLHALYNQVWSPIEKQLPPEVRTTIISPDGQLCFVSFATLISPDDKFLSQRYSIRYVSSGRDLVREAKPVGKKRLTVYAFPDFGGKSAAPLPEGAQMDSMVTMRSVEARDFRGMKLSPLPGTEREAQGLQANSKAMGWEVEVVLGPKATEASLRQVQSPRILHLATHGFFLPDLEKDAPDKIQGVEMSLPGSALAGEMNLRAVALKNPMRRSVVALAGAQTTLQAWEKGEIPPTDNDGIVTAEEVGLLKLGGTWLVTLSACETGSGEAKAGEGVLGMRRGFIQAGTQNLLMTLWPVADEDTAKFMIEFYTAAQKSGDAPKALADLQRDRLVRLRQEKGLLYAVNRAGPFILSFQGKPQ